VSGGPNIGSCSHGPVGRQKSKAPPMRGYIDAPQARGDRITVLKFGSSVLRDESDLPRVVHEIYRHWRSGSQVWVVVSALGDTTDRLLRLAKTVSEEAETSSLAMLLATGESTASALLGIALTRAGIPGKILDPAQAGLRTIGDELNSELVAVDLERVRLELARAVVVLPGFAGRNEQGDTTLLGRGGSDLSAVFLAHQLGARCILLKDVDGLYTSDPAGVEAGPPLRFNQAKYETALRLGGAIVQDKAVRLAAECGLSFEITSIGAPAGTEIGRDADQVANWETPPKPLRVALLGCGTVGGGVYQRLTALPELFEITGVAVRDLSRTRTPSVPAHLLTTDADELVARPCDVVVELIGGIDCASNLVNRALRLNRHVVTANKALISSKGEALQVLAVANEVTISASAAVGGALPALETIEQASKNGTIANFCGVLNGTTNFILDRVAQGEDLQDAIHAAQRAGYAEADPSLDLDGTDAAQKLILLARAAFDVSLPIAKISRRGIEEVSSESLHEARERGCTLRLVASCRSCPPADGLAVASGAGLEAQVAPVELPFEHPLAQLDGAQNGLIVEMEDGAQRIALGTGAGRWPTTESVMADLLAIHHGFADTKSAAIELEECVA
jgi:homoserine dehydrogenase